MPAPAPEGLSHTLAGDGMAANAGILHWRFQGGDRLPAHCLMRWRTGHPDQVVLTALAFQNPHYMPLTLDLGGVATAALPILRARLPGFDPRRVHWVTHHGLFSTYDRLWTVDRETFTAYRLRFDGARFHSPDEDGAEEFIIEADGIDFPVEPVEPLQARMGFQLWRRSEERDGSDAYPLRDAESGDV